MRKRVAIVGSGCTGIGALYALKNTDHDVHLFEADEVLGGHTNTDKWKHDGKEVNVDTGFIVYNTATYPNFIEFLRNIGVESAPTHMTFGVSRDSGAFEWSGTSLGSVFAHWSNVFSPRMWRLIFDIVRFNQYALDLLHEKEESEVNPAHANGATKSQLPPNKQNTHKLESVGEYLEREQYSTAFRDDYLIPMTAAVWSTSPEKASLHFPIVTLVRFMWNHHLLSTLSARPSWMTIPGGSQQYIDAVMKDFPQDKVHLNKPVTGIEDINGKIILQLEDDEDLFDHVILACHGDQAFALIEDGGTEEERAILDKFDTTENITYLHSDTSLMPRSRRAWAAWNLLTTTAYAQNPSRVCLTYNMNILQHLPTAKYKDILVTMNPIHTPAKDTIQGQWIYQHPLYTAASIHAQSELPSIQNTRGISYAGAWTKYGFHEDGFSSGLAVAIEHLGGKIPWEFVDSTFSRGRRPELGVSDYTARFVIFWIGCGIWCAEAVWGVVNWPFRMCFGKREDGGKANGKASGKAKAKAS